MDLRQHRRVPHGDVRPHRQRRLRQAWPADPRICGQEAGRRRSVRRRVAQRRHRAAAGPAERAAGGAGAGRQGRAVMTTPYTARRARLLAQLPPGAVAVLHTAPEVTRNADSEYLYRHDSYFYYLTGFTEPEAAVVLVAAHDDVPARAILFCREKNLEREIWEGYRHGPEAARTAFGFDEAYTIESLDERMAGLLSNAPSLYYALGGTLDARVR